MACADVRPQFQLTTSMITLMKYDNLKKKKKFNIDVYMAELRKQEAISKVETITIHSDSDEEYERIDTKFDTNHYDMEPTPKASEDITRRTSSESSASDASTTSTTSTNSSASSLSSGSKKRSKKVNVKVHFGKTPISGVSRPPTATEHWTLYYWETHAMTCKTCAAAAPAATRSKGPFRWRDTKTDAKLCDEGTELARDVEDLELESENGAAYSSHGELDEEEESIAKIIRRGSLGRRGSKSKTRVEVPHNYKHCWRLIKGAVE